MSAEPGETSSLFLDYDETIRNIVSLPGLGRDVPSPPGQLQKNDGHPPEADRKSRKRWSGSTFDTLSSLRHFGVISEKNCKPQISGVVAQLMIHLVPISGPELNDLFTTFSRIFSRDN